jgi:hypothetical protein
MKSESVVFLELFANYINKPKLLTVINETKASPLFN